MDIKDVDNFIKTEEIDLSEFFDGEEVFVQLREPTTGEFYGLVEGASGPDAGDGVYFNNFMKLLPKVIVEHNFTKNEGKKASAAETAKAIERKVKAIMKLIESFQKLLPLEEASPTN